MAENGKFDPPEGPLRASVGRGAVAIAISQGLQVSTQIASVLILSRLLAPGDLGLVAMYAPLNNPAGWLFISLGRSTDHMIWGFVTAGIAIAAFGAGISWRALGVAVAYAISEYIKTVPLWIYVSRRRPVRIRNFARACGPFLLAAHLALLVVWMAQAHLGSSPALSLIAGGLLSYAVVALAVLPFESGRATLREAFALATGPLKRRRHAT